MTTGGYGGILPGRSAFVCYGSVGGAALEWHSRLVLAHAHADHWVVLTPDLFVYIERMSSSNPELSDTMWGPSAGGLPGCGAPSGLRDFQRWPRGEELRWYIAVGAGVASAERRRLGIDAVEITWGSRAYVQEK